MTTAWKRTPSGSFLSDVLCAGGAYRDMRRFHVTQRYDTGRWALSDCQRHTRDYFPSLRAAQLAAEAILEEEKNG
jgi:hypothetical protein